MADERIFLRCTVCDSAYPFSKWWWDTGVALFIDRPGEPQTEGAYGQIERMQEWMTDHVRCVIDTQKDLFKNDEIPHIRFCTEGGVDYLAPGLFKVKRKPFWKRLFWWRN